MGAERHKKNESDKQLKKKDLRDCLIEIYEIFSTSLYFLSRRETLLGHVLMSAES